MISGKSYLLLFYIISNVSNNEGLIMNILSILLIFMLCMPAVSASHPAPVHIGHGLIGNLNPHETGAVVLGTYFDPNQGTYDNYWSYDYRVFDYWRLMSSRFMPSEFPWRPPVRHHRPAPAFEI